MGKKRVLGRFEVLNAQTDKEAVNLGQVKDLVNRFVKETVRVATTSELAGTYAAGVLTLTTPVTSIDGITLNDGDRILVKDQLDKTQNGIYTFNGGTPASATADIGSSTGITGATVVASTFAMSYGSTGTYTFTYDLASGNWKDDASYDIADISTTCGISYEGTPADGDKITVTFTASTAGASITRSEDCKEGTVLMNNTTVPVAEGTSNADTKFVLTSDGVLTVGGASLVFIKDIGTQTSAIKVVKGTITGDGTTTTFNVAHNLNLTDPESYILHIKDNSGNDVEVDNDPTTSNEANSITLTFAAAPLTTEAFKVFIVGLE